MEVAEGKFSKIPLKSIKNEEFSIQRGVRPSKFESQSCVRTPFAEQILDKFFIIEDLIIFGLFFTDFFRMVYLFGSGRNSALSNHYKSFRRVMFAMFCDS